MSSLKDRVEKLEKATKISVPVVDENGDQLIEYICNSMLSTGWNQRRYKKLTLTEAFRALEDMCDIQVTYQESKGKVVIYEKEDDN